jgi:PAS domain S-box-containing protein
VLVTEPNFQLLFQAVPGCYLVLSPELRIVAVSDAYLRATMTERATILGRGLFEVFPDNPDDPEATGVANLRASLERVLTRRQPDRMAVQKYDIRRPESEGGGFEERFWSPLNCPALGPDGSVAYIIHSVEDVSDVVRLRQRGSEQEAAIQELVRRSERRYAQLLDAAPDAIVVVDEDGVIELVNAQTEQLFGYERSELVGKHLELLIPERFRGGHAAHVARFVSNPGSRPMGSGLELFGRKRDGTEIPIEVSLSPLRTDGRTTVSAAIRDITERKRTEAAAKLSAERLASAVDSMQDAFALFDARFRLVLCNSVYRRFLADSLEGPLVGRSYEDLLEVWLARADFPGGVDRESFRAERLSRRRDETDTCDLRLRDGRSLRLITRSTAEGGIVQIIWDLTEDERRAEEVRTARAEAEAASTAKSNFLSSMSHELRTPMNAILGFAQLVRRDKKEPVSERHLTRIDQILKGGEHLLRLIDDILDLSRIEAGRVSISTEPVNLVDVLADVTSTLETMAAAHGITVDVKAMPEGLPVIAADRVRFAQILMNFGSNAIKYNRAKGRVGFHVAQPDPMRVRITIEDTGVGIPLSKQDKLFQPFQRAGQETGPIQGTGIGLVITKRLAELMGGSVGFRSVPGEGSVFWVDMPVHAPTSRSSHPAEPRAPGQELLVASGSAVVLYVEDNPANVTFMEDLLSSFDGVTLVTAPNAEEGIVAARTVRPRAILMDINLPGMSGVDALHALRKIPETEHIPVIALTAAASERDRHFGKQAGFYRYLTKPVKVDELVRALEDVFATSPGAA